MHSANFAGKLGHPHLLELPGSQLLAPCPCYHISTLGMPSLSLFLITMDHLRCITVYLDLAVCYQIHPCLQPWLSRIGHEHGLWSMVPMHRFSVLRASLRFSLGTNWPLFIAGADQIVLPILISMSNCMSCMTTLDTSLSLQQTLKDSGWYRAFETMSHDNRTPIERYIPRTRGRSECSHARKIFPIWNQSLRGSFHDAHCPV